MRTRKRCPFCNYAGPSPILYDFGTNIVFQPLHPVTEGHVLVVPKVHIKDAIEGPATVATTMNCAAAWAGMNDIGDCNFITSVGPAATQTVRHLHIHIVPRRKGDGLLLPWSKQ